MYHLAVEMLHASDVLGKTPVLVFPRNMNVREGLLIELVRELQKAHEVLERQLSSVRFDWMLAGNGVMSVVGDAIASRKATRLSDTIQSATDVDALVQVTATIGRPTNKSEDFVGGWARDGAELPQWTSAFHFQIG